MNLLDPPERNIGLTVHLDTNRINAFGKLEHVNKLEEWDRKEVILLELSETAQEEALAGRNIIRRRRALSHIVSLDRIRTPEELVSAQSIEAVLFPSGAITENEKNDVLIVFNALKYGAILVTADGASRRQPGGILGNKKPLRKLGVEIMSDEEAVNYIESRIALRDESARKWAEITGTESPEWVGAD